MIPRLPTDQTIDTRTRAFLDDLRDRGFSGDTHIDYGRRIVASTDNSVYQFIPDAICVPRNHDDVVRVMTLLDEPAYHDITVTARGGGTGTNGQSLTTGIVLDTAAHMNAIEHIDVESRTARVQPGVVLDQFNEALRPHGMMFAPTVSTGNRATIGGMISTDAAGKGSRVYGKTSSHVKAIDTVLIGGQVLHTRRQDAEAWSAIASRDDVPSRVQRMVHNIVEDHRDEISRVFPNISRFVSGYNLAHVLRQDDGVDLTPLICGSEGTLGIVTSAELRLTPIPKHSSLVIVKYRSFDDAVASLETLIPADPTAVETMDETLLDLVRTDAAWNDVSHVFADDDGETVINLVEFTGDDPADISMRVDALCHAVRGNADGPGRPLAAYVTRSDQEANAFWTLRKRAVGLMANLPGRRQPIAFVEDAVVPPEHLRAFARDVRGIFDEHDLVYGMYGHVDVGVLHVRPALDMRDDEDVQRFRAISDSVAERVQQYGGVIWGEHGKGVRGEYNALHFGETLCAAMRQVKRCFDPRNQLNPGKIATATETDLVLLTIDAPIRGERDRTIAPAMQHRFEDTIRCNGNGVCHSVHGSEVMCPSWKATGDRRHTPKGRAGMMREWLRLLSEQNVTIDDHKTLGGPLARWWRRRTTARSGDDFSHELYDTMHECLACKGCSGQCPVNVDVPDFRASFLQAYHDRYPRRLRDHLVARLEQLIPIGGRIPFLANVLRELPLARLTQERLFGIQDAPAFATPSFAARCRAAEVPRFDRTALTSNHVVIVPDAFTSYFTPETVIAFVHIVRGLGFDAMIAPYRENGKSSHVKGFLRRFRRVAARTNADLRDIASSGAMLIGIDPAVTLTYRDEYVQTLGDAARAINVMLAQEWLADVLASREPMMPTTRLAFRLFAHCTERATAPASLRRWIDVFEAFGATLDIVAVGCCGMCGVYGHEREHVETSKTVYDLSWGPRLRDDVPAEPLVTGYSCRSQVKRIDGRSIRHPLEALAEVMSASTSISAEPALVS